MTRQSNLKGLALLLLAGTAIAHPPPPDSPLYVPPPTFIEFDRNGILDADLKGTWETKSGVSPFKFEITGQRVSQFNLRVLAHSFCKQLLIDQDALTVGYVLPTTTSDPLITMVEIKFDGDRDDVACLGMPVWITFRFDSPPNYHVAKVTIREQFVMGQDEKVYEMIRTSYSPK